MCVIIIFEENTLIFAYLFKRHNANDTNRKGHNRATQATSISQWHGRWWLTIGFKKKKKNQLSQLRAFESYFLTIKLS